MNRLIHEIRGTNMNAKTAYRRISSNAAKAFIKHGVFYKMFYPKKASLIERAKESIVNRTVEQKIKNKCEENKEFELKLNGEEKIIRQEALKKTNAYIRFARFMKITVYIHSKTELYNKLANALNAVIDECVNNVFEKICAQNIRKPAKAYDNFGREYSR